MSRSRAWPRSIAPLCGRCAMRSMRIGASRRNWWSAAQGCRPPPRRPGSRRGRGTTSRRSSRCWRRPWRSGASAGRCARLVGASRMTRWSTSTNRVKTLASLRALFGELRPELKRILAAAQARPPAARRAVRRLSAGRTDGAVRAPCRCNRLRLQARPHRSDRPSVRDLVHARRCPHHHALQAQPHRHSPSSARCTRPATASTSRMSTRPSRVRSSQPTCSDSMPSEEPATARTNRNPACSRTTSAAAPRSGAVDIRIWSRHFRSLHRCRWTRSLRPSRGCRLVSFGPTRTK